ncbi:hypothetical protein [Fusobacterium sp. THCT1E2]
MDKEKFLRGLLVILEADKQVYRRMINRVKKELENGGNREKSTRI